MSTASGTKHQRYRAPSDDNTTLVVPPLDQFSFREFERTSQFEALQELARAELADAARTYTATYRDVPEPTAAGPLILTGHQAELFHPGVWFKNFVLSRLAAEHGGTGIHLVIDTDEFHTPGIRVPTGSVKEPRVETVAFDSLAPVVPVEARTVSDHSAMESFAERVSVAVSPLVAGPLVRQWWPRVLEAVQRNEGLLGLAIAQARHQLEGEWGCATLEIPMSQCCEFQSFHQFCGSMLHDAARVREAYNAALASYRIAHRLRSDAQPMPDLAEQDDWIETPFWVWTEDAPRRQPLFVQENTSQLRLSDRAGWSTTVDAGSVETVGQQLGQLASHGVKLHTRALTTTLFARLLLGDVFLHGIGGAKYDEVADDVACRLWGAAPPPYLTLSATLRLPIEHHSEEPDELRKLHQELRHLEYHPERYERDSWTTESKAAAEAKRQAVATAKTPANAADRHREIVGANARMQSEVEHIRKRIVTRIAKVEQLFRSARVLDSREYSFCLFPEDNLRERMQRLIENSVN